MRAAMYAIIFRGHDQIIFNKLSILSKIARRQDQESKRSCVRLAGASTDQPMAFSRYANASARPGYV